MRFYIWPVAALLAACEPPPQIDVGTGTGAGAGAPGIEIVYPENNGTYELEEDCSLFMPVAVDLDNFTLQDPAAADGLVEGQGHFHIQPSITPGVFTVAYEPAAEVVISAEDLFGTSPPASLTISFTVDLVDNEHAPIDADDNFDIVEFTINPPLEPCELP